MKKERKKKIKWGGGWRYTISQGNCEKIARL